MNYLEYYKRLVEHPNELQAAVADAVAIEKTDLSSECLRQATTYMTWGYMHALAQAEADSLEFQYKEVILPRLRLEAKNNPTGKKVTEQGATDTALGTPEYQAAYSAYLEAKMRADLLKKVEMALVHKREMLQILNFRERDELRTVGPVR